MTWLEPFLVKYPELALFLVIALGYAIGGIRIKGFALGPVTGSLFAGIVVGQIAHVVVPGMAKSFLFLLFLFGIGYSVGPQFMRALRRDGVKPVLLALVCCTTGLLAAVLVAKGLGLDPGFAAGLLSGALTESPAIGTATEAIDALPLPEDERARLVAHIAVADAVRYIFGAVGVILFCSVVGPRLLGVDLAAEAAKLEAELGITRARPGVLSAWRRFEVRAYRLDAAAAAVGQSVEAVERRFATERLFVLRVRRGEAVLEARPDLVLEAGDVLAVAGRRALLIELVGPRGEEVDDQELLDIPIGAFDLFFTSATLAGRRLGEIAGEGWTRAIYLRSVTRGGEPLPVSPALVVERGDILQVVGPEAAVERAAPRIGAIVAPTSATDFVTLGLAIFLGGVAGVLIAVPVAGTRIALGTSVGALLAGLLVGHLRTRHPLFGRIPDGAVALMTALGLAAFVGAVGLHAGPVFMAALAEAGLGLLLGGVLVTLLPMVAGLQFGHHVLEMNPVLLLGGLAGAQTMTAAMAAVQDRSGSPVAVLGYTPCVPVGHILLTTWGSVIVMVVAG